MQLTLMMTSVEIDRGKANGDEYSWSSGKLDPRRDLSRLHHPLAIPAQLEA